MPPRPRAARRSARPRSSSAARLAAALLAALAAAPVLATPALAAPLVPAPVGPAAVAATGVLVVEGRGYGHGRGLGQYGSLGYAVDHGWDWRRITDHYYGGTTLGSAPGGGTMTVRLTRFDGAGTIVQQERGALTTSAPASGGPTGPAVRVERVGANRFAVFDGPGCAGPWTRRSTDATGPVRVSSTVRSDDRQDALQICEPGGVRWVRGEVLAVDDGGAQRTVNSLPTEAYLRGVVPRESPASWGDLGGGRGLDALRAQAVAARSYAEAEARSPYAKTCDTTSCQVYVGVARQVGATFTLMEDPRTDRAIADTAGQVRLTAAGRVARTEFSSSTGGHTAGGTFPPVEDLGDATVRNPNRSWRVDVPFSSVEAAWPGRGALRTARVVGRTGVGTDGGRATTVALGFSGGDLVVSGEEFRSRLGLKSTWVRLSGADPQPVRVPSALPSPQGWTLDLHGGLHPVGGAHELLGGPWWPWGDVARGIAVGPSGAGVVLDAFGGLHPVAPAGTARPVLTARSPYWTGWAVARDVALMPGRSDAGWVLDAFGGVHPFGGAPEVRTTGYWPGWDVARSLALLPDGSGGYVLDAYGALHPVAVGAGAAPAKPRVSSYTPGHDLHRDVVVRAEGGGWTTDATGAHHAFGGAPAATPDRFFPGTAVASALDPAGRGPVVTADRTGRLSTAASDQLATPRDTWAGDVVRGLALRTR